MKDDFYHTELLTEVIRYAKLQSMNLKKLDEYGAAVYATWYTQGSDKREEHSELFVLDGEVNLPKNKGCRFTAHTHPGEPLVPSPDDLLVYERIRRSYCGRTERQILHFLIDGYTCRKVRNPDDEGTWHPENE